jgi:nicotinamidase-related amidase
MANAVLVVDMLRCFMEAGHALYVGDKSRGIIPHIQRLLEKELNAGSRIFFICDRHDPDDLEFRMFPPHCVAGTEEAEVIPELAGYPGELIPKKRYSGFFGTQLEQRLKESRPDKLIICGVLTNICVMHTTADARNRDYEVEIPVDCVASLDEAAHHFALEHMEKVLGARLVQEVNHADAEV